jgi:hypothetical protein
MATFRLIKRAESLIETREFATYNEAAAYAAKLGTGNRPFRKNPTDASSKWAVSRVNTKPAPAQWAKVPTFNKPVMYDFLDNITCFLPQPEVMRALPEHAIAA